MSGSLLIAALAVGAALGSGCGVAVAFSLLLSARLVGDWQQAARALLGRAPAPSSLGTPRYPAGYAGGYPTGYPAGYPDPALWRGREDFPDDWADSRRAPHAAERRR